MTPKLHLPILPVCAFLLFLAACGSDGESHIPPTQTPSPTATIPPEPPPPTATPTFIPVPISGDIANAIRQARPGSVIAVPPGSYGPLVLDAADLPGPITVLADATGAVTGTGAGAVVLNARAGAVAVGLEGVADLTLDGFTIVGGSVAGIELRDTVNITIRNCLVRQSAGDGIRILRSVNTSLFNNLIYNHRRSGIAAVGAIELRIINNTIYDSKQVGISIGDSTLPSDTIFLRNNILDQNLPFGISIHASTTGYDADYNLNRNGYGTDTPRGAHDLNVDPEFVRPGTDTGFRLPGTDENCNGGSPAMDAGDPYTDSDLVHELADRTTQIDGKLDCTGVGCCPIGCVPGDPSNMCVKIGVVDLGYHYIPASAAR